MVEVDAEMIELSKLENGEMIDDFSGPSHASDLGMAPLVIDKLRTIREVCHVLES